MIELIPMSDELFQKELEGWIRNYASEKARAGNWKEEESLDLSRKEFRKLLPDGLNTEGHYIMSLRETGSQQIVGMIWFGIQESNEPPGAFIWDFSIYEQYRGKGYGKQALEALHRKLKEMGTYNVSLHVFGHNKVARSLYEKMGYEVTNVVMSKKID